LRGLRQLRQIAALVWFDGILPLRRSPFSVVNFIISPITILFFIYVFAGPSKAVFALSGGLIAVVVGSCIVLETEAAFLRLVVKLQDMFVSSPMTSVSYVVGLSLAQLLNGVPGIALFSILIAIARPSMTLVDWGVIALALILTWALVSSLGFLISTFARDVRDLWVYSPLLNVVLAFVPPVFYPITLIPLPLRYLAYFITTTFTGQMVQQATGIVESQSLPNLGLDLLGAILYAFLLIALSARYARWRAR
jgi:ABC-2 type transport system permease protein